MNVRQITLILALLAGLLLGLLPLHGDLSINRVEFRFDLDQAGPQAERFQVTNHGTVAREVEVRVEDFGIRDGQATFGIEPGARSIREQLRPFPTRFDLAPGQTQEVEVILAPSDQTREPGSHWAAILVQIVQEPTPVEAGGGRRFGIRTVHRLGILVFGDVKPERGILPDDVNITDLRMEDRQLRITIENPSRYTRRAGRGHVLVTHPSGEQVDLGWAPVRLLPQSSRTVSVALPEAWQGQGPFGILVEFDYGASAWVGAEAVVDP